MAAQAQIEGRYLGGRPPYGYMLIDARPIRTRPRRPTASAWMAKDQIAATVNAISDLMQALRNATTEDKAEIYAGLKPAADLQPGERTVTVQAEVEADRPGQAYSRRSGYGRA
jgi:hypothetical protein